MSVGRGGVGFVKRWFGIGEEKGNGNEGEGGGGGGENNRI